MHFLTQQSRRSRVIKRHYNRLSATAMSSASRRCACSTGMKRRLSAPSVFLGFGQYRYEADHMRPVGWRALSIPVQQRPLGFTHRLDHLWYFLGHRAGFLLTRQHARTPYAEYCMPVQYMRNGILPTRQQFAHGLRPPARSRSHRSTGTLQPRRNALRIPGRGHKVRREGTRRYGMHAAGLVR